MHPLSIMADMSSMVMRISIVPSVLSVLTLIHVLLRQRCVQVVVVVDVHASSDHING